MTAADFVEVNIWKDRRRKKIFTIIVFMCLWLGDHGWVAWLELEAAANPLDDAEAITNDI